jgi:membrane fusion protein, multidrug efflux system
MSSNWAAAVLAVAGLLTLSCTNSSQANSEDQRAVHEHTEVIQRSTVSDQLQVPGTVRARTGAVVSSKIVGQILSLSVREGDRVHEGQLIAEIDNREAASQLRRAQAAVTEAQSGLDEADRAIQAAEAAIRAAQANRDLAASTLKRYDLLQERGSISPHEYDEVETRCKAAILETERAQAGEAAAKARRLQIAARIEQAEAEVNTAQVVSGYSRIVSPIDGIVVTRHADPGTLAAPGMPLVTLEDDRSYELEVAVEESHAGKIAIGQSARIEIDALQSGVLEGRVREIVPSSDPGTRTYTVRLQITNLPRNRTLRSGFFGRAFFSTGERNMLTIPESALRRRGQLEGVYLVQNNVALLRLVKTGRRSDHRIEITSGLEPGARIVTAPTSDISDGVKIIDEPSSRKTP